MLDIYNVLDAISEIVYVSDAETHEILYINEAGKKILGDCLGETCYNCLLYTSDAADEQ